MIVPNFLLFITSVCVCSFCYFAGVFHSREESDVSYLKTKRHYCPRVDKLIVSSRFLKSELVREQLCDIQLNCTEAGTFAALFDRKTRQDRCL
jgi:hypothetical protein